MPKRVSSDIDHVPIEPPTKKAKKAPPKQWQLPKFKPQAITGAPTHGYGSLPDDVSHDDPYAVFSLFFTEDILQTIADHTNEYAQLYPGPVTPYSRVWEPTTAAELKAFLGAYIWMGVHPEAAVKDFWNINPELGPIHEAVTKHIQRCSKRRPFTELSNNTLRRNKRPEQILKSRYGCELCNISICNHIRCWKDHLDAIQ